jgi:riboflavin transporter FmnP
LGAAQILTAAGLPPLGIFLHSLAMALTSAIGLVGTRQLKSKTLPQALVGAVVVTAAMTLTMSILDYGYVFK